MAQQARPLAVVTGASSGIGFELAHLCAKNGYDLLIAADRSEIHHAAQHFRHHGVHVEAIETDLSTIEGVDKLYAALHGMPVEVLCANAGQGLGHAFLDQDFAQVKKVVDTNVTGTIYLLQKIGRDMRNRGSGRILITGSIAGFMPGSYQAVYNGTKAFIDSFSFALRNELMDSGVTVTCLMPGATDTNFFNRADMLDTRVAQGKKDDPADVAETGFNAMMRGDGDIVSGWRNKISTSLAAVTPSSMLAQQHRKMAEPLHESRHRAQPRHDDGAGLWSVMLPAGLAVAAGVALMSSARARQALEGNGKSDWRSRADDARRGFKPDSQYRSGLGQRSGPDSRREQDYAPPSRSASYPDGQALGASGAPTRPQAPPRTAGSAAPAAGLHANPAARTPFETANSGRQSVGDSGAFRNVRADEQRGTTFRVTE
ncbi:MAG: oxidoreductase [Hyphomicrobiales bacterium]|nr:oxidoreductase [Hyphomicrobiales bacterium]